MVDLLHLFENKCSQYIDELNTMYCYLVEPFLLYDLPKKSTCNEIPTELTSENSSTSIMDSIPPEYFNS